MNQQIASARTLGQLKAILDGQNRVYEAAIVDMDDEIIQEYKNRDLSSMPNFGGDDIDELGTFSWDEQNKLIVNDNGNWIIVTREV